MVGVLLMVSELIGTTQQAQIYINARSRAAQHSAKLIADLRGAGLSSRRLFQDDAEGRSYLAALNTTGLPLIEGAKLPVVDAAGRLDADTAGARRTGNTLLLACEDRPQQFTTSGAPHRVDVVRFIAAYPTRRPGKIIEAMPDRIDIVRFASRQYADRASLDQITDPTERSDVVQALRAAGIDRTWVAGAAIGSAFFALNTDGTIAGAPIASPVIDAPPDNLPRTMLGEAHMSVAPNSPALRVPSFAQLDVAAPAFPSGFEVKVVGPSGGRQVLVRHVLLAGVVGGPDAEAATVRLFSVRDL